MKQKAFSRASELFQGEVIARTVNPGVEVQGQYSGGAAVELFTIGELPFLPQEAAGRRTQSRLPTDFNAFLRTGAADP